MLEHMWRAEKPENKSGWVLAALLAHRLGRVVSEGMQDAPGLIWGLDIWARHSYRAA